ncbi:hypothetical protein [Botrimarina mediterranea]|uniref:PEP-CTERM protein-sorting domain-containing protein n=1 Tax=Botrimarina mediterranea TaxID=2528022 RepID=A0A518K9A2_9BACT|nr:hypothetical protein [Botrimarina mediterranea]QDV74369.1 hypothetical protein Spa11_25720 [Botrimarina mediterranea]
MTTKWRLVACTLVGAAALGVAQRATAVELLTFGNFELPALPSIPEVPFWTLEEFRTADPSLMVDSASLAGFADNPIDPLAVDPDHRGLWIKPFSGNEANGTTEAILTQIVAAVPGQEYSFTGDGLFEANYGGTAGFSTDINFELAFLDSSGMVIGSPLVRDLETELIAGLGWSGRDGNPDITPLVGVAPAGAASVRVRAQGLNMTTNTNGGAQSAFVDNFSLTTTAAPTTQLLENANLNILPEVPPTAEERLVEAGWEFIENPEGVNSLAAAGFANNPATGGTNGIWVRPFVADADSASIQQSVAGVAGTEYMFTASSRWEVNFYNAGGDENQMLLELAFLDSEGVVIDSSTLDLRAAGQTADNNWHTHSLSATAPAGTVDVRVAGITNNITANPDTGTTVSAFWDDFSLMAVTGGLAGDYNSDGKVDAADYTVWRDGNSPDSSQAGYDLWADNYGTTSAPSAAAAIPEPTACVLVLVGLTAVAARRRLV